MKLVNKIFVGLALALGVFHSAVAAPLLLNSPLEVSHRSNGITYASGSTTVKDDNSDIVDLFLGGATGYRVDLNSTNLLIDFYTPRSERFNGGDFNGLYISDPALDANALINSAVFSQSDPLSLGLGQLVKFDDHSFGVNFSNIFYYDSSWIKIEFSQPTISPVPEPESWVLMLSGLLGIAGVLKRKKL